jgi:hypothetical protein
MAVKSDVNLDSLFAEQSLFEIYLKAPSFFSNTFNGCVIVVTALSLTLFASLHLFCPSIREAFRVPFADTFALWSSTGAALAGTILGFLIAGFAILCTVLRPQTMIALQRIPNKRYGESELKLLFVLFVEVLVQYLSLLLISIVVMLIGGKTGPAALLGYYLAKVHWMLPFAMLHICFAAWGTLFVLVILTLKSFVYNLYSTLLLGIADAADDYQRSCLTVHCENMDRNRDSHQEDGLR